MLKQQVMINDPFIASWPRHTKCQIPTTVAVSQEASFAHEFKGNVEHSTRPAHPDSVVYLSVQIFNHLSSFCVSGLRTTASQIYIASFRTKSP